MARKKTVIFNLFRPTLKQYRGRNLLEARRYNFTNLLEYMIHNNQNYSVNYKDEDIAIYSITRENFEESLYHIKIVKFRRYDLPSKYTPIPPVDNNVIENEDDNILLQPIFNEELIDIDDGSTIGESMSILYDQVNNTFVIQSNVNCTTITGLVMLFSSILDIYVNEEEIDLNLIDNECDLLMAFSPILAQREFEEINNLETITEIEYTYEDNNMQRDAVDVIDYNNEVQAGTVTTRYYVDSRRDKARTLNIPAVRNILNWFRQDRDHFKKMVVKGRADHESNIDTFELINSRLYFKHTFRYEVGENPLNSTALYYEMERYYLGENVDGYRELANY